MEENRVGSHAEGGATVKSDRRVAVLMSGGVDSSVAALLLLREGWEVVGVTMNIPFAGGGSSRMCCRRSAAAICEILRIPHEILDVQEIFEREVIGFFRNAYRNGLTPSPCVDCNAQIKFGWVWERIEGKFDISQIATGHYAQILVSEGRYRLSRGIDRRRDQSYFLYRLPYEKLDRIHFPLGRWTKEETRTLAAASHLPVAEEQDSMELCFAAGGDYRTALGTLPEEGEGVIVDLSGKVLGRHSGIWNFTVGQRKGLGIATGQPLYVLRIDVANQTLVVGPRKALEKHVVVAKRLHCLVDSPPPRGDRLFARIRSTGEPAPCIVEDCNEERVRVRFDEPVFAPAPGQHLVLYKADGSVVGGGEIESSEG